MFFKKENEIHALLINQIDKCIECYETFVEHFNTLNNKTDENSIIKMSKHVSDLESEADIIRRKIIKELLEGALLPGTRRDIKILVETIDKIPNKSEEIFKQIMLQNIKLDNKIKSLILDINNKTKEQFNLLKSLIDRVFLDLGKSFDLHEEIELIEKIESEIDDLEEEAIRLLYKSEHELAYKNQIKTIISDFAEISDIIEDISDNIEMIIVMRKV